MENQKSAPVYQVVEKFVSINGEGRRAGELAVFIRMKGCNLHCSYCDTYWANESDCESTEMTADEIISYIEESRIRNITLTGGEPLLREGMTQLICAILQDPQRRVEIETNGSIDLTPYCKLERRPAFTMDYKMPESGMEHAMLLANMETLSDEDTVKFVVSSRSDMERAVEIMEKYRLRERTAVYLSPVFGKIEPVEMVDFLIEKKLNDVKLQLQLHKIIGAAARLYLVCLILQHYVFDAFHIPFAATVIGIVLLIWLYTRRSGIRTIVWTDSLQTLCLLLALGLILYEVSGQLNLDFPGLVHAIRENEHSRIFVFDDWHSKQNFFKQFFSGIFITIVMTGLDQDMMQKNLSCKNLREAQKNMYCYGISFVPVNFLFLSLGILLLLFASQLNIPLPAAGDEILPLFAAEGHLGFAVLIFFTIGIIAAAFSSADSALTALTTSFCIDIAGISHLSGKEAERRRKLVHFCISVLFIGFILLFKAVNNKSVIDAIYTIASYTYGPLLGLFAFGLFTPMRPRDRFVPYIAIASPLLCYAIDRLVFTSTGYQFGYEMLMFNGFLTFMGLTCLSIKTKNYGNTQCRICSK